MWLWSFQWCVLFVYKHLRNALQSSCFQTVNKYPESTWFRSGSSEGGSMGCLAENFGLPAHQDTLLSSGILLKYHILALRVPLLPLGAQRICLGWGMELPEGSWQHSEALKGNQNPKSKSKIRITISTTLYYRTSSISLEIHWSHGSSVLVRFLAFLFFCTYLKWTLHLEFAWFSERIKPEEVSQSHWVFSPLYEYWGQVKWFQCFNFLTGTHLLGSPVRDLELWELHVAGSYMAGDASVYQESLQLPAPTFC